MHESDPDAPESVPRRCAADKHNESGLGRGYLKVPFARCGDGIARHVTAVVDGCLGPFKCLDCEEPLTLRRPRAKRAHFSHRPDSTCNGETALHKYAKELLASHKTLTLPELVMQRDGLSETVFKASIYSFDEVRLELRLDTFQPDAVVLYKAAELAIEFLVSHSVDAAKRAKVLVHDLSMVEVDLSKLHAGQLSSADLDQAILHTAPRTWIHHRKRQAADAKLTARIEAEKAQRGKRLQWHIQKQVHATFPQHWRDEATISVAEEQLGHLVGLDIRCGHWFTVPPSIWQAQALSVFLIKPSQKFTPGDTEIVIAGEWPRESDFASKLPSWMIRSDLKDYPLVRLEEAGFDQESFGRPHSAIWYYLSKLCALKEGFFWNSEKKAFYVERGIHGRLYRRSEIRRLVVKILDAAQKGDSTQAYLNWLFVHSFEGETVAQLIEGGGAKYERLLEKLSAIAAMLPAFSRRIADDLCGLPVEWILERNLASISADQASENQRKIEAANRRKSIILQTTIGELGQDAMAWLQTVLEPEGLSIADFASTSDTALHRAERLLAGELDRRRQSIAMAERIAALRLKLTEESCRAFQDTRRAELFLNSGHPKIGGCRPIEYCSSERALGVLLGLLPKRR